MNEIWKDIPNLAGLYQASDIGNITCCYRVRRCVCNTMAKAIKQAQKIK